MHVFGWSPGRTESRHHFRSASGVPVSVVVERRAFGIGRHVGVGRVRPRRIEMLVDGRRVVVPVPAEGDPWMRAAVGVLVVWAASAATRRAARMLKEHVRAAS